MLHFFLLFTTQYNPSEIISAFVSKLMFVVLLVTIVLKLCSLKQASKHWRCLRGDPLPQRLMQPLILQIQSHYHNACCKLSLQKGEEHRSFWGSGALVCRRKRSPAWSLWSHSPGGASTLCRILIPLLHKPGPVSPCLWQYLFSINCPWRIMVSNVINKNIQ